MMEEEEEEEFTGGNWRGKHNSLSRGAGADQTWAGTTVAGPTLAWKSS